MLSRPRSTIAQAARVDQILRLLPLPGEDQFSDPREGVEGFGAGGIVRSARPQGVLVELETLCPYAAEHHGPEAAVAHRESFEPLFGRLVVEQAQPVFLARRPW